MPPSGLLIIDKDDGPTSHDIVARVRRYFGVRRVGHAGTLDPFATGVLVLLVGRATLLSQFLVNDRKSYRADIRWGEATDTMDRTGQVVETAAGPIPPTEKIREVLAGMQGDQTQVPPMYSAKKVGGKPLYNLARKGIQVERKAVGVRIEEARLLDVWDDGFRVFVTVSKGTYIRVLADSLGRKLGGLAHLSELRRVSSGGFHVDQARRMDEVVKPEIEEMESRKDLLENLLVPMSSALDGMPELIVEARTAEGIANGTPPELDGLVGPVPESGKLVRLGDEEGRLLAVGRVEKERGRIVLVRVLAPKDLENGL